MAATKINLHSIPDLKNTTDDAIAPYMTTLNYQQSHHLTDVRLTLGFSACAIAAATFYYDFTLGWAKTKDATLYAVVAYFVLNTLLTVWIWAVEGGTVYVGRKGAEKITIETYSGKYSPVYEVKVTTNKGTRKVKGEYMKWFDVRGRLVEERLREFLEEVVGGEKKGQ
ncbi:signal peptidase complex subunit 2 [Pyronema omphalodes]|nr:signal peptidase complex subunit 2 [Pyronema omphalodes]